MSITEACDACLRRTALLARLSGHVEQVRSERRRLSELFAMADEDLLAALGGGGRAELARAHQRFDPRTARVRCAGAGLTALCRHAPGYPAALTDLPDPPAVLHVAGDPAALTELEPGPAVAIVGARRAGSDALEVARVLARGLSVAGVPVISGMALGVDSAAHAGALEAGGRTVAVLAGGADVIYPRSKRRVYERIVQTGCVVSEMPPGFAPLRWSFPARNRLIAGLADLIVVVEAAERSGSLITADLAQELGRTVAAVPGPVTTARTAGTNALLRDGAVVVRHAQDALDEVLGVGAVSVPTGPRSPSTLEPELVAVLEEIDAGSDTLAALATTPAHAEQVMSILADLELRGLISREIGGRYRRVAA